MPDKPTCMDVYDNYIASGRTPDMAGYLKVYDQWLRDGSPGLAPSPLPFGLMSCDCTNEICELEGAFRDEYGLSSWRFYDPAFYGPMMAARRKAALERDAKSA